MREELTDGLSVRRLHKNIKRQELQGIKIDYPYRDADRQVVSDAIGLVNKALRTLRE